MSAVAPRPVATDSPSLGLTFTNPLQHLLSTPTWQESTGSHAQWSSDSSAHSYDVTVDEFPMDSTGMGFHGEDLDTHTEYRHTTRTALTLQAVRRQHGVRQGDRVRQGRQRLPVADLVHHHPRVVHATRHRAAPDQGRQGVPWLLHRPGRQGLRVRPGHRGRVLLLPHPGGAHRGALPRLRGRGDRLQPLRRQRSEPQPRARHRQPQRVRSQRRLPADRRRAPGTAGGPRRHGRSRHPRGVGPAAGQRHRRRPTDRRPAPA